MEYSQELRVKIRDRLAAVSEHWSTQYDEVKADLEFASGDQWAKDVRTARESGEYKRPCVTKNVTDTYCNRIVNSFRLNPFGIRVSGANSEATEVVQKAIAGIEYKSNASEAYETAHESQVRAGIGWIGVGTDYVDDFSIEQTPKVLRIKDPRSVWLDPHSEAIDGSDAEFGFHVTYMDKDAARAQYGEDVNLASEDLTLYRSWNVPANSVAIVTYYEKQHNETMRYWLEDGRVIDKQPRDGTKILNKRKIDTPTVVCYKVAGEKILSHTTLQTPWIPLVPVYGEVLYLEGQSIYYGGIVRKVKDTQRTINYVSANEQELIALAPKSPFLMYEGQDEGYEGEWAQANQVPWSKLTVKAKVVNGALLPLPQRANNVAQTGDLRATRQQEMGDMGIQTGIMGPMLGEDTNDISGRSRLLMQNQGEIPTAHYTDNLSKSVAQVGRIVVSLLPSTVDTPRPMALRDEKGTTETEMVSFKDLRPQEFDVETHSGPSFETRKRESQAYLMELVRLMPDKAPVVADLLAGATESPISQEVAERFKKLLPPELQEQDENAPDPQAMQALQAAQQTIEQLQQQGEYYENIIQQLQSQIIDNAKDREADLAEAEMDNATKLAIEQMKQEGLNQREAAKIASSQVQANDKIAANFASKAMDKIPTPITETGRPKVAPMAPGPVTVEMEVDPAQGGFPGENG